MSSNYKVGRPKLADKGMKKAAICMVAISLVFAVCLTLAGFNSFNNLGAQATMSVNDLNKLKEGKCPVAPTIEGVLLNGSNSNYDLGKIKVSFNTNGLSESDINNLYIVDKAYIAETSSYTKNGVKSQEKIGKLTKAQVNKLTSVIQKKSDGKYEKVISFNGLYLIKLYSGSKLCYKDYVIKDNFTINDYTRNYLLSNYNIVTSKGVVRGMSTNVKMTSSNEKILKIVNSNSYALKSTGMNALNGSEKEKSTKITFANSSISGSFVLKLPDRYWVTGYLSNPLSGGNDSVSKETSLSKSKYIRNSNKEYIFGTDIKTKKNENVYAMDSGTVTYVRKKSSNNDTYGKFVQITSVIDGKSYIHSYDNLSSINVKDGDRVHKNQVIGKTSDDVLFVSLNYKDGKDYYNILLSSLIGRNVSYMNINTENYLCYQSFVDDYSKCSTSNSKEKNSTTKVIKDGWATKGSNKIYYKNGKKLTGWKKVDKKQYYFDKNGYAVTDFKYLTYKNSKDWYYFDENAVMQTGWQKIKYKGSESWYYFKTNGKMVTGWQKIDKKQYYFNGHGQMLIGFAHLKYKNSKNWYYFNKKGVMLTDWQKIENNGKTSWYYFKSNGAMVTGWNKLTFNKKTTYYYFSKYGRMADNGWHEATWKGKKGLYYFNSNGTYISGTCKVIDGKKACFSSDGTYNSEMSIRYGDTASFSAFATKLKSSATTWAMQSFTLSKDRNKVYVTQMGSNDTAHLTIYGYANGKWYESDTKSLMHFGHVANVDMEYSKYGEYIWIACGDRWEVYDKNGKYTGMESRDATRKVCRKNLSALEDKESSDFGSSDGTFGTYIVDDASLNLEGEDGYGYSVAVDNKNNNVVLRSGSTYWSCYYTFKNLTLSPNTLTHQFCVYNKAQNSPDDTRVSWQGFAVENGYIYVWEGNNSSSDETKYYNSYLSIYDTNVITNKRKINVRNDSHNMVENVEGGDYLYRKVMMTNKTSRPDGIKGWYEPEGIQVHDKKIFVGFNGGNDDDSKYSSIYKVTW